MSKRKLDIDYDAILECIKAHRGAAATAEIGQVIGRCHRAVGAAVNYLKAHKLAETKLVRGVTFVIAAGTKPERDLDSSVSTWGVVVPLHEQQPFYLAQVWRGVPGARDSFRVSGL